MKRIISILAALSLTIYASGFPTVSADEVNVTVNGQPVVFDVAPYIMQDRTMVPMRAVFEALGADVQWDEASQTITVKTENDTIVLHIGSTTFYRNDQEKNSDVAPVILDESTMVPLRAVSEALDATVNWNEETQTVVITMEDDSWKENTGVINLDTMEVSGQGVVVDGNIIRITAGGDFEVSGVLENGMIQVNAEDKVKLRLSGAHITNTTGPAIFFENAKKAFITLNADTENSLTDGSEYNVDAKATLFSNDDLEIKGSGSLKVYGNYKHGIASDDDIDIQNGNIEIDSVNDGIHANNTIRISGGTLSVNAERDGIQSDEDVDISGGVLNITTTGEIETKTEEGFGGGRFHPGQDGQMPGMNGQPSQSGGQPPQNGGQMPQMDEGAQAPGLGRQDPSVTGTGQTEETAESISSKGIKAGTVLSVSGGTLNVNTTDHALHSTDQIQIKGGEFVINSSAGKGISGHGNVTIDGGDLQIGDSTEGIESKAFLTINGGDIRVHASDDGINAGGTGGGFGQSADKSQHEITVNGGYLWIDAEGDGIDSNGDLIINGGTVLVNGPTSSGNGALDSDGSIQMNGGILVAAGSAGMAEAPGTSSIQNTVKITYDSVQPAGTLICITGDNQEPVVAFAPEKEYQSVIISSPALETGSTYTIYSGGDYQGDQTDGFYSNGSYDPEGATIVDQFVPESVITTVGNAQGNMTGGGMRPGGGGRPNRTAEPGN